MTLQCGSDVPVLSENALRFSIVSRPVPHIEYLRTISSLIGASHILAIFEENDAIKVYFDDRRSVDAVISNVCLHVLGHHVKVDYVVPPGTKIILSNVDPIITDSDILSLLSEYGTVVSPIFRPPISDDTELCHIKYGVRYVYLNPGNDIPPLLSMTIGDHEYKIRAYIDDRPIMIAIPFIKSDILDTDDTATVVSNEGTTEHTHSESNSVVDLSVMNDSFKPSSSSLQIASTVSLRGRRGRRGRGRGGYRGKVGYRGRGGFRGRGRGRPRKELFSRPKQPATATSVAAMKIKRNAKNTYMSMRRRYRRIFPDTLHSRRSSSTESTKIPSMDFYGQVHVNGESSHSNSNTPFKPVLERQKLESFLGEVKGARAPIDLARKYLGDNFSAVSVDLLCKQLVMFNSNHNDINLKSRIGRLIKALRESVTPDFKF